MLVDEGGIARQIQGIEQEVDLVVVGGGLSGVCAALAAARRGLEVALVQDRPVLGGNASSEVRLWILGATSHMGNNNRWAREGGIMDELLVENMYRNPEGNPLIFDTILLEKVTQESRITLRLNTAVFEVEMGASETIVAVKAYCSQNQTMYHLSAPYFVDASGDGILGFLAGAAFRMGAESEEEFGEKFAPSKEYGELLGHSLYFYSKDMGKPVKYVAPSFALKDISQIPRFKSFNAKDFGCRLWWVEYGGRLDTIKETETIKWELWKVIYGVWDYIKNSGNFPEAENLTLEWVGTIPGKRESRRFEGDYMMIQQDIVEQRKHYDAVGFGGWSIDLHPADGVFSEKPGCNQWHSKGIYQIPYRSLYSRNISNLFLAGRIISASHVAFGSTRVMATGGLTGQIVGTAASLALAIKTMPRALATAAPIQELQQLLLQDGVFIPGVERKTVDLSKNAAFTASSHLRFQSFAVSGQTKLLSVSVAQMIPLLPGKVPVCRLDCRASAVTTLEVQLRVSIDRNNHTPECILERKLIPLKEGSNALEVTFEELMPYAGYAFITFMQNQAVSLAISQQRVTGLLAVFNNINPAVSNWGKQDPQEDIGVEAFEFWCPARRPEGQNLALQVDLADNLFSVDNLANGIDRPTTAPNAWVADWADPHPEVALTWEGQVSINAIEICFDTDFDHPMESVLMGHPERIMPFCVRKFRIYDDQNNLIWEELANHESIRIIRLSEVLLTRKLTFQFEHPAADIPAAVFAIRCYNQK